MKYIIDHIPRNTPNNRRPGHLLNATRITIHNTGNPTSTARNERNWLTNPSNNRTASYHIVVDEKESIECLPLNENSWAAGDGTNGQGNRTSIHVEICESGNYSKTLENAADLVANMLKERGWGIDRLRRHWDWPRPSDGYRKICPRLMYDNGHWTGWKKFVGMVEDRLKEDDKIMEELKKQIEELKKTLQDSTKKVPAPDWFTNEISEDEVKKLIHDPHFTVEGWRTLLVVMRAIKNKELKVNG